MIKHQMHEELSDEQLSKYHEKAKKVSDIVSETERKAISMERELEKLKKAQYMERWVGHEEQGVISGITSFGIFVQLPNTVEGLVRFDTLTDDYYEFDQENYRLVGCNHGRQFRLGDSVKVVCTKVDTLIGAIDFKLS